MNSSVSPCWKSLSARSLGLVVIVLAVTTVASCQKSRNSGRGAVVGGGRGQDKSGALLEVVASQLAQLPKLSVVELEPEVPILDAKTSSDGQDVMAVVTSSPDQPHLFNRLFVRSGNARFRSLGVHSGDLVRFYGRVKSELESEYRSRRAGRADAAATANLSREEIAEMEMESAQERVSEGDIVVTTDVRFRIAQVIDDNTLLLEEPLNPMIIEGTLDPSAIDDPTIVPPNPGVRLEVWRVSNQRMGDLVLALNRYARDGVPRLGWEPSPDEGALRQIVERLNQWLRQSKLEFDWKGTEMVSTLPESIRGAERLQPFLSSEALERMSFSMPTEELRAVQGVPYEGRLLQEATWARDIGGWASEGYSQAPDQVAAIFDWIVRNIQLVSDTDQPADARPPYRPWQSILHGRGEVEGRVWVFAQMCRQLGVPVVVFRPDLAPEPAQPTGEEATEQGEEEAASDDSGEAPRAAAANNNWEANAPGPGRTVCGAVIRGEVYLFDPYLGLPIPAAGMKPATLAQVRERPELLRQLDLEEAPYPLEASHFDTAEVQIVAEPFALTRRAALLESRLTGEDSLVLQSNPEETAGLLKEAKVNQAPVLWPYPFEVLLAQLELTPRKRAIAALEFEPFCYRPFLWQARVLHFRGRQPAGEGTLTRYATDEDDHQDAGRNYTRPNVMVTFEEIRQQEGAEVQRAWLAARLNASYWVGLLKYDQGEPKVALTWFRRSQTLEDLQLKWYSAARYNEARSLEAMGETDEAIAILEADDPALAAGSRQRAKLLRQEQHPEEPDPNATAPAAE